MAGKGLCHTGHLGKGRMRLERKKALEPRIPIGKGPQHGEGRGRTDSPHPVRGVHHVTAPALQQGHPLAHGGIVLKDHRRLGLFHNLRQAKGGHTGHLIACHRALPDLGRQPISEPGRPRMRAAHAHAPDRARPFEHRAALVLAQRDLGLGPLVHHLDPHPDLERKTRHDILQEPALHQGLGRAQAKPLVIGAAHAGQQQQDHRKPQHRGPGQPIAEGHQQAHTQA